MSRIDITAQIAGPDISQGRGSFEGNAAALRAGANLLFVNLLPAAQSGDFLVVDRQITDNLSYITKVDAAVFGEFGE